MKVVIDRKKVSEIHKDFLRMNVRGMLLNTDNEAYFEEESIWIKDNYFNFLYTEDLDFLLEFDKNVGNEFGFSGTNDFVLDYYKDHELIHWKNSCNQYHYPGGKFESVMALDSLSLEDADYVNEHYEYKNDDSLEKIKHAIKSRPTSCLRLDGKIVSFVLLHDDDSIGYMFTLPEHRGKGYAFELTKDIINKTIDSGRLPYVQIVTSNENSIGLALKTGFVFHGIVHWFGVVKLGEDFDKYIEKYKDIYKVDGKSVSVQAHLRLNYEPLDVEVTPDYFLYQGQSYPYKSIYEDEIYYVEAHMEEDILVSGLMKLMENDYDMVIINQKIESKCFKNI